MLNRLGTKTSSVSGLRGDRMAACGLFWTLCAVTSMPSPARAAGFEVDRTVEFKPGTAKARATLQRIPSIRDMVAADFEFAGVDLNDDGHNEILVLARSSAYCGSGGCMLVVLEQRGPKIATLLTMNTDGSLGVTRSKIGAYRALAAVDGKGAIVVADKPGAPLHGKPMVYPMAGASLPVAAAQAGAAPAPAQAPKQPADVPTQPRAPAAAPAAAVKPGGYVLDVLGIHLGMPIAESRAALRRLSSPAAEERVVDNEVPGLPNSRRTQSVAALSPQLGSFQLHYAPPPDEGRLVRLVRAVDYLQRDKAAAPVTTGNLQSALIQKYGEPELFRYPGSEAIRLQWVWLPNGNRAPAAAYARCFANDDPPFDWSPMPTDIRQRNASYIDPCGVLLEVKIASASGVVTRMDLRAFDLAASVGARVAASRALTSIADQANRKAMESAAKNKPAI